STYFAFADKRAAPWNIISANLFPSKISIDTKFPPHTLRVRYTNTLNINIYRIYIYPQSFFKDIFYLLLHIMGHLGDFRSITDNDIHINMYLIIFLANDHSAGKIFFA